MAVEFIIAKGIGFSPGSVQYLPTHGFVSSGAAPAEYVSPVVDDAYDFGYAQDDLYDFLFTQDDLVDFWDP